MKKIINRDNPTLSPGPGRRVRGSRYGFIARIGAKSEE